MSKLIDKYLTKADIKTLNTLKDAMKKDTVTVTCMGLYNHGKSTLLNVLIKDFEQKTFKTADVRETSINKSVKYGNITFVDTPGLNAKEHDDKRVMDAVKESDINLFVHTVTTGEFAGKEMEFLQNIKKHWKNPQEFIERTIFVVSRVDKANSEEDIINTTNKMKQQILEIFGVHSMIVPVSAMRYSKGKQSGKKLMVKKSNIEALEILINELSNKLISSIRATKKQRIINKYNSLMQMLNSQEHEVRLEINKQKQAHQKHISERDRDIETTERTLRNMYSRLT